MTAKQRSFLEADFAAPRRDATAAVRWAGFRLAVEAGAPPAEDADARRGGGRGARRRMEAWEWRLARERGERLEEQVRADWESQPAWNRLEWPAPPGLRRRRRRRAR